MVCMRNSNVSEKIKCRKIDKYFYRDPNGNIFKIFSLLRRKKL